MAIFTLKYKTNRRDMTFRGVVTSFSDVICNLIGPVLYLAFILTAQLLELYGKGSRDNLRTLDPCL